MSWLDWVGVVAGVAVLAYLLPLVSTAIRQRPTESLGPPPDTLEIPLCDLRAALYRQAGLVPPAIPASDYMMMLGDPAVQETMAAIKDECLSRPPIFLPPEFFL